MEIKAFRGWRYHSDKGDVSSLLAPPYDILSQADKDALLAAEPDNIVAVDLPHVPPAEAAPDGVYQAAAGRLEQWTRSGLLRRDERPALYAYEQDFRWAGKTYRRRAMIAAVRVAEFGRGVWPHEKTFPGVRVDRMKLTQATGMQLSPIFGFYEDDNSVAEIVFGVPADGLVSRGRLGGVEEKLWAVTDPRALEAVSAVLADRDVFIADGHHRYMTALEYSRQFGEADADHPANYVMFVLASMSDPGLIILPSHRVIGGLKGFDLERLVAAAGETIAFQRVELGDAHVTDADGYLRGFGRHAMAFAARGGPGEKLSAYVGRLQDRAIMARIAPDDVEAWRELDVAILHRLVIDRYLLDCRTEDTSIEYTPDGKAALAAAGGRADLVVFLQATPLRAVREVALAGEVMPHKSTYFYPKPATGLVLYPLK